MSGARANGAEVSAVVALRRRALLALAVLAGCLAVCLSSSPAASALSQRGHELEATFGEGSLIGPSAVAVNEETGEIYVLDSAGNRVVVFNSEHQFLEAWGRGVGGGSGYEVCTSGCKAGMHGYAKGAMDDPVAIAVDNAPGSPSHGDVYVVANRSDKHTVLDKFSPKGELIAMLLRKKEEKEEVEGIIVGVAVDQAGSVWVEREDGDEEFVLLHFGDEAPENKLLGEGEAELENLEGNRPARPGFAAGPGGTLFMTYEPGGHDAEEQASAEEEIGELEQEIKELKKEKDTHGVSELEGRIKELQAQLVQCETKACVVAKLSVSESQKKVQVNVLSYELDPDDTTGVAAVLSSEAQQSGDVYLDEGSDIAAFDSRGALIQRFGSPRHGAGAGLAADARTEEVLVADSRGKLVEVYRHQEPGPPAIEPKSVRAGKVQASSAQLRATIDPDGTATEYRFEYCVQGATECAKTAQTSLPPGYGNQLVSATVVGLRPDTAYTLSAIAEYTGAQGKAQLSEEGSFKTLPAQAEPPLPDGRAWELVSPAKMRGATIDPPEKEGNLEQAAADGKALAFTATGPLCENEPEGNRGPEPTEALARRTAGGWTCEDIATPNGAARGASPGLREYQFFSSDLGQALIDPQSEALLAAGVTEPTLYLRQNASCAGERSSCFEPLITPSDETSGKKGGEAAAEFLGATPDLSDVILKSAIPLIEGVTGEGLYEWSAGSLTLVSVLPDGKPAGEDVLLGGGSAERMSATALSRDGSRVIWRTGGERRGLVSAGHLYEREVPQEQTLQVDEPEAGLTPAAQPEPTFQTASASGSRIFFTDPQRLTRMSVAPELASSQDLYVFEPEKPAGERLTDLTIPVGSGEAASVQGAVLGTSEDGSFVYFVANGVLASGATPGDCARFAPPGAGCNVYVAHFNGEKWETQFIARVSNEDSPDWGRPEGPIFLLEHETSEVSGNGEYLAFMSDRSLTGYDNTDENSGAADEEVFLYHYEPEGGKLICASCDPSGAQPVGVHDDEESGEGYGLEADRQEIWLEEPGNETVDHWLAGSIPGWTADQLGEAFYQPHYLTGEGRLFFDSPAGLVPRASNVGKEDVYEYEPLGVGGCAQANTAGGCVALISSGESINESAFIDASESGNDVFFLTTAKLLPRASEAGYAVYDARVCEAAGAEPCPGAEAPAAPECSGEGCKGAPQQLPSYGAPASSTLTGSGNLSGQAQVLGTKKEEKPKSKTPTKQEKLAAALKACRKDKSKKKRLACEKQARKRYDPKASRARHARDVHLARRSSRR